MHEDHRKSTKIMKPMKFPDVDDILPHVPSLLISSALPVHLLRQVFTGPKGWRMTGSALTRWTLYFPAWNY